MNKKKNKTLLSTYLIPTLISSTNEITLQNSIYFDGGINQCSKLKHKHCLNNWIDCKTKLYVLKVAQL